MNITIGVYLFHSWQVIIKKPFEIIKDTEKCYFTNNCRFLKSEIGIPRLKSATRYPYIEVVMVDADERKLREKLSEWFQNEAITIKG